MRGLRDVARISRAKGADLQAICAMKERLRLAQSILRQPFDEIGILGRFSRLLKADFGHRKKRDSSRRFGLSKGVDFAGVERVVPRQGGAFKGGRHARACPGHPRSLCRWRRRGWPGQSPAMTVRLSTSGAAGRLRPAPPSGPRHRPQRFRWCRCGQGGLPPSANTGTCPAANRAWDPSAIADRPRRPQP